VTSGKGVEEAKKSDSADALTTQQCIKTKTPGEQRRIKTSWLSPTQSKGEREGGPWFNGLIENEGHRANWLFPP